MLTRKVCSPVSHIPTKRPETCAKGLIGAAKVEELKTLGIVVQFEHTVMKFQHLACFGALEAAQVQTDETVRAVIGEQSLAKLQAKQIRCIPFALYQALKEEEYELRTAARQR
jgi:hypothetical protein